MLRRSGLNLHDALTVLDFGCGPGFIWDHLRELNSSWLYTALDFSPESIKKILKKAEGSLNFKGAQHITQLPANLSSGSCDVVLLFEVVEHLNDQYLDATLVEVARLLKPGGVLVITTPNEEDLNNAKKYCPDCGSIFHEWQHIRSWSKGTLMERAKMHGLKMEEAIALDFASEDWSPLGIFRKIKWLVRGLIFPNTKKPHLIATFKKI